MIHHAIQGNLKKEYQNIYNRQKLLIAKYDQYLHQSTGPHYLKQPKIARQVCSAMRHLDQKKYDLVCFCVMSNHAHILFTPLEISEGEYHSIERIMHSIKSYTANKANKILNRIGKPFWNHESFDHYSRSDEETERIAAYILNNPVKAGFVETPEEWEWSYFKYW